MQAFVLCALLSLAPRQDAARGEPTPTVPDVDPKALATWERTCRSTFVRDPSTAKPVTAFDLELEVRTRGKTGSNDLHTRLRWLAPAYLRFELSRGNEQARGPDGYWLRKDDEIVSLSGREYTEDRRQIEDLLVIVHNFVALTQPAKLEIRRLHGLAKPPPELRRGHTLAEASLAKRLEWIELDTPGLRLDAGNAFDPDPGVRRVQLGIDRESALPIVALVSDATSQGPPVLLHLDHHRPLDDVRVPRSIFVYGFERRADGWVLDEQPTHEMFVVDGRGTLRATLTPDDFRAPPPR